MIQICTYYTKRKENVKQFITMQPIQFFQCVTHIITCSDLFSAAQKVISQNINTPAYFVRELEHNINMLLTKIFQQRTADISLTDSALIHAKSMEEYLEVLVRKIAFYPLKKGDAIARSLTCDTPQYIVHKILEDGLGMRAVILVPEIEGLAPPLLLFRCTDALNIHNILDDLREYPGELNFERNKERLRQTLEEVSLQYGAFHVLGFSYGGALAQKTVAHFPEYIERCTSINGLRPGKKTVELFLNKMKQFPQGMKKPEIWDLRHAKDLPSVLGGEALPISEGKSFTFGSTDDAISHIEAHTILCQSNNLPVAIDINPDESFIKAAQICENIRKAIGFFATPIHNIFLQL